MKMSFRFILVYSCKCSFVHTFHFIWDQMVTNILSSKKKISPIFGIILNNKLDIQGTRRSRLQMKPGSVLTDFRAGQVL